MAFKSKSRKCKRSQKRVKSYMKRSGKKVRSFCRRKSNRKSRSMKRRSSSRKKCPPNKKAIRSYRRKSGKRVKSYCRNLYYYPNGQVVPQPIIRQPVAPQGELGYEYGLPVMIPDFNEQKEAGRKYEKKEGQLDIIKKDIENVMEEIKRCGQQGKMYSSKLKQCIDRPVIKQQDKNEMKDLMGKIK